MAPCHTAFQTQQNRHTREFTEAVAAKDPHRFKLDEVPVVRGASGHGVLPLTKKPFAIKVK